MTKTKTKHVVSFSGGIASAYAAHRVIQRHGHDGVVLLFADTKMEDEDLYRFMDEVEAQLDHPVIRIADGRTPWELFHEQGMIGNTRADLCSRVLKRKSLDKWMREHAPGAVRHVGIWPDEQERLRRIQEYRPDAVWDSPLLWKPWASHCDAQAWLDGLGVRRPRLYDMGFKHNNCGGFCVKSGHAQFARLLEKMPERFAYHERQERKFRVAVGKDVAILRDRRGGATKPLPLRVLRERIEASGQQAEIEWDDLRAGCGCAVDYAEGDTP